MQDPPGGPPDVTPPVLLAITPDSGGVLTDLGKPAVIQFDEVINERPGVELSQLIVVSPRAEATTVAWKRDAIEVRPKGGWKPNVPYQVTLLPGVTDLRNNKLGAGRMIVFSTGGAIPATRATGRVVDWEGNGAAARALIELIRPDSLVFWGLADSTGTYSLTAVPPGTYVLTATVDRNNNRQRDFREPYDSTIVTLDSTLSTTLWAFVRDTAGPRLRTVARADTFAARLEFGQALAPAGPAAGAVRVLALPDSTPLTVVTIQTAAAWDSSRARPQTADTTRQAADTARRAPIGLSPGAMPRPTNTQAAAGRQAAVSDSALIRLLATRPKLGTAWIVVLQEPLRAGGRYLIAATATNVSGAIGESTSVLVLPAEPARRDSIRADTTATPAGRP